MADVILKGEWLRCSLGHGVAKALQDVVVLGPFPASLFSEWMMAPPDSDCPECACGAMIWPHAPKPATPQPPEWKGWTMPDILREQLSQPSTVAHDTKPTTPEPPAMGELVAKELRQCEENGVADNALIRTSDGGYWRYWADSKSWHSVQAPWVALQARIDAAVARRKAKREPSLSEIVTQALRRSVRVVAKGVPVDQRTEPLARAMSTPLPHDPDIHTRLMPWRGKE